MTAAGLRSMTWQSKALITVLAAVAAVLAAIASAAFVAASNAGRPLAQPVTITACTPETYEAPEPGFEGPHQADCSRWFSRPGQQLGTDQIIQVAGQVCLDHPDPIAYQVTVAWESLTTASRFVVLDTPLTWDPGCADPYSFPYTVPVSLANIVPEGESLGRWRLVGRAVPVEDTRFAAYQWDGTGSVELISAGQPADGQLPLQEGP